MPDLPSDPGHLIVSCDGAARGNPGPAGIGAVVATDDGTILAEIAEGIGETTNNVAEYRAMIAGLERAAELGAGEVTVKSDSNLLVEQMNGRYRVKHPNLKPLYAEALGLASRFERITYTHVRREFNTEADRLANIGVDTWLARDR
ncbi:MAG: reverse transcriptase-like protein [Actinomycetota bacterium]